MKTGANEGMGLDSNYFNMANQRFNGFFSGCGAWPSHVGAVPCASLTRMDLPVPEPHHSKHKARGRASYGVVIVWTWPRSHGANITVQTRGGTTVGHPGAICELPRLFTRKGIAV